MKEYNNYLNSLKKLISFKSVLSESKENMPFGEENYNALNFFLALAQDMGFETINYDNYAGEVYYGEGEEVGIIGHLDVVPASFGWNTNPYELTVSNGKLFGRGVEDDKGPMLLCLYALKELKDSGIKFNRKIRLFVGSNEETGWKDVEYLKTKTSMPEYGFSPDGNFPVIYAEKGVYYLVFSLPKFKNFTKLEGGTAVNSVCARASVISKIDIDYSLIKKYNLEVEGDKIISNGVTAHGSAPEKGLNAFIALLKYMQDLGEDLGDFIDCAFFDKLNVSAFCNEQGKTTVSPNLIKATDNGYELFCDMRLPAPFNISELTPTLNKFYFPFTITEKHNPVLVEKEGWFVNTLIDAYNAVTGENGKPMAMGGSTFARAFNKGCAFGICTEGGSGGAHEANEYITEEWLKKAYEIYLLAIKNIIK